MIAKLLDPDPLSVIHGTPVGSDWHTSDDQQCPVYAFVKLCDSLV